MTNLSLCFAGTSGGEILHIEGSALLDLRELKVLDVAGWYIYLMPQEATSNGSVLAELALTELHTSMVFMQRQTLLDAALRGGIRYPRAIWRLSECA